MQKNRPLSLFLKTIAALLVIVSISYFVYGYYIRMLYPLKYEKSIKRYSEATKVNPYLLCAIIREESRFNPEVQSNKGAVGLMQLMPKTAGWISKKANFKLEDGDLVKPENNIKYGSWYYSYLKGKYESNQLALSAYNAGTANVDKWVKRMGPKKTKEKIPFSETRNFVSRVTDTAKVYQRLYPEVF
jgi:soluble lytic murein transglycosylase